MPEPTITTNQTKCATCGHAYGMHYRLNDRSRRGCSYSTDDQRDGAYRCSCTGFTVYYDADDYPINAQRYDARTRSNIGSRDA